MLDYSPSYEIHRLLVSAESLQARGEIKKAIRELTSARLYIQGPLREVWSPLVDKIDYKLKFQQGIWDPSIFNKDKILRLAESNLPDPRYIMGMLWRVALKEQESQGGHSRVAKFLFDAHERISADLGLGHLSGNGIYVASHRELEVGSIDLALVKLQSTATHFASEELGASPYFKPFIKLAHLLATLSIAFELSESTKSRSYFCLALAGLILDGDSGKDRVIVRHGAGLEAFVRLAERRCPRALAYLEQNRGGKAKFHKANGEMACQFHAARRWLLEWNSDTTEETVINTIFNTPGQVLGRQRSYSRMPGHKQSLVSRAPIVGSLSGVNNTLIVGVAMGGDQYNSTGQAGAIGPQAQASDMVFHQLWTQGSFNVDFSVLQSELSVLREAMRKEASEVEHDLSIAEVASAEQAAKKQDGPSVLKHLGQAGKWALDIAGKVGVNLTTELLKRSLG